ncbi:MAG: S-adenosylhomocysteine hydrolase [Chlorobiales bacterium]|nr:S-adenosylhomocysteine hydrolase [Chlorobiales bacterium]
MKLSYALILSKWGARAISAGSSVILSKRGVSFVSGMGVFAKARISSITGKQVPREPLEVLAEETLRRLHIDAQPGQAQRDYASAKSTQVPVQSTFNTGCRRISRKLILGNRTIRFENNYSARS